MRPAESASNTAIVRQHAAGAVPTVVIVEGNLKGAESREYAAVREGRQHLILAALTIGVQH